MRTFLELDEAVDEALDELERSSGRGDPFLDHADPPPRRRPRGPRSVWAIRGALLDARRQMQSPFPGRAVAAIQAAARELGAITAGTAGLHPEVAAAAAALGRAVAGFRRQSVEQARRALDEAIRLLGRVLSA